MCLRRFFFRKKDVPWCGNPCVRHSAASGGFFLEISIHPSSRIGLDNPDKGVLIHICCVYSGYHAVVSHVKMNHDTFATDNQRLKLSIRSAQKTWSVFAEAFSASARDFGACTPKFSLVAMMNWHLNYKGPNCIEKSRWYGPCAGRAIPCK